MPLKIYIFEKNIIIVIIIMIIINLWTRNVFAMETEKNLRFQTQTDTCERYLRLTGYNC